MTGVHGQGTITGVQGAEGPVDGGTVPVQGEQRAGPITGVQGAGPPDGGSGGVPPNLSSKIVGLGGGWAPASVRPRRVPVVPRYGATATGMVAELALLAGLGSVSACAGSRLTDTLTPNE